jgi:hypothetical protein
LEMGESHELFPRADLKSDHPDTSLPSSRLEPLSYNPPLYVSLHN